MGQAWPEPRAGRWRHELSTDPDNRLTYFGFFNEIGIIAQLSRTRFEQVLPEGMKLAHFGVLNHFVRLDRDSTPARLASAFQVTRGAMTNTLQRLESQSYVLITPDPSDGRGKRVSITEAGRKAHARAVAALGPDMATVQAELGAEPFTALIPGLEAIRIWLDEQRNED